jgi:hypothetical protein
VSIFARELTDDLAGLVKQIDEQVFKNEGKEMAAFVVLLTDDANLSAQKLEELAKAKNITKTPLTIFQGSAGPPNYKIAGDADVTVMMWKDFQVKTNHAFKKGELNAASVQAIVADTSKILQ